MIDLKEHNEQVMRKLREAEWREQRSYVMCPNCNSAEMLKDGRKVISTCPPKQKVICPECDYEGYKYE